MADRNELHLSERDYAEEPLAAKLAEFLIDEGLVTRVDTRGRAVDADGNFTEGEWDDVREKYIPNKVKSTVDPTPELDPTPEPEPAAKPEPKRAPSKAGPTT